MKVAIYTSFAVNYLAKARVLVRTVKELNPSIDVIGICCDRFPDSIDLTNELFDQIWMVEEYPATPIKSWIFRHTIMELCTAVKGWGLRRLLAEGYDYVMYLDPDCLVLRNPAEVIKLLPKDNSVGVVPHTTRAADSDEEIRIVETSSLRHGIYNLGFLLVRNDDNGQRLASWWAARLDKYCVDDFKSGLFTDQRWFDLAVGYYDFIKIIRHAGIDVASWNVGQRTLKRDGDGYSIDGDPLIFYHFSGVGPTGVHRWVREKFAPSDPLVSELEFKYERLIAEQGQAQLEKVIPFFDRYDDGSRIPVSHRSHYRNRRDLAQRFSDPYVVALAPCFRDEAFGSNVQACGDELTPVSDPVALTRQELDVLAQRLFDPDFYRSATGSSEKDFGQLWSEYCYSAWRGSANGNKYFDVAYYCIFSGPIDKKVFPTPFHHYFAEGLAKKLSPNWIFDDEYYRQRYADVSDAIRCGAISCGFEHFSRHGVMEGRSGCAFFNERAYLDQHPDIADAVARGYCRSGAAHYVAHGASEGRLLGQRA